jgi:hypothetical protein
MLASRSRRGVRLASARHGVPGASLEARRHGGAHASGLPCPALITDDLCAECTSRYPGGTGDKLTRQPRPHASLMCWERFALC